MCGITGAAWTDPQLAVSADALRRMTDSISHRGPDDAGYYQRDFQSRSPYPPIPGVALGHRRLSIIDLAGGHQPLANEDETVWTVFNGEIYNFHALRSRLEGAGHTFRTHSDTETIVHLYEDEGPDCFRHFNGMFAIAIWDQRERRLVLGRDRLGQKPVYYYHHAGRIVFGSELKTLLALPDVPREVDPSAVDEYLTYQYVPHPNTILKGIKKLAPGELAVFSDAGLHVERYWKPDFAHEDKRPAHLQEAELRELFDDAVRLRLQADVPLGAFLSGGIDSSLVVSSMQKFSDRPVKTFSIGFPQKEYDETSFARQVATHLGTEHHEFQVTPSALEILPKLIWHYDEPMADSSAIPTWYVSQQTRAEVTVALSGDGGDELFAGYRRYRAVGLGAMIDRLGPLKRVLGAKVWQKLPSSGRQKSWLRQGRRFSEAISMSPQRRYLDWISIFNESRRGQLYSDEFVAQLGDNDPFDFLKAAWQRCGKRDAVTCASLADLVTYLPCDLNCKVDIASMAHALEVRQPFLDYRLVEYAAALPISRKYSRGRGKQILRKVFGDRLPKEIWNRPKMGFGVPLDYWFRHELKELLTDSLLSEKALSRGLFREETVRELLDEHMSNQFDHSARLWALLVLELWQREWIDA
ncbi:asparagine synthase (glutamine-hydrolyzing) [Blastopirellula sp. JC732]|uniref:asparagine synthase (glutamine-hydrolyzing) n=1 Tax=Blastopirellula sediminis TaxID=2894196 RepID=A0A9X1SIC9_9BACT|nr:asparagine synthase (glutamine-hydrolyzing) [Blastopirellula sediminis]MCC9605593.1 asparagine synthase (glutamine-hydrolyzing) [Blastopirellula sediminis]MCC9631107.1 asparagine synthase (glutamine-hydrolyzing) [Blastopirellula sediminis]